MDAWSDLQTFNEGDASNTRLVSALQRSLEETVASGCSTGPSVEAALARAFRESLGVTVADVLSALASRGLCYVFTGMLPQPLIFLCPIVGISDSRRLRDYSRAGEHYVTTANGEVIVYTVVSLGKPFYSLQPGGLAAPAAFLLRGKMFSFTHVLREKALHVYPKITALSCAIHDYGQLFGTSALITLFAGGINRQDALNWVHVAEALETRWLWERFINAKLAYSPEEEDRFIGDYISEMEVTGAYHEVAGHYRDQTEHGHVLGTPSNLTGLYEVRASLAHFVYSPSPLYGFLELISFMIGSTYHRERAEEALTVLLRRLQQLPQGERLSPDSIIAYAQRLDAAQVDRLRRVAVELLENEFALREGGETMAEFRSIEEAADVVRELGPLARFETLSPQERMDFALRLGMMDLNRILAALEYLVSNLPTADPRQSAAQVLLPIVRNAMQREPARSEPNIPSPVSDTRQGERLHRGEPIRSEPNIPSPSTRSSSRRRWWQFWR